MAMVESRSIWISNQVFAKVLLNHTHVLPLNPGRHRTLLHRFILPIFKRIISIIRPHSTMVLQTDTPHLNSSSSSNIILLISEHTHTHTRQTRWNRSFVFLRSILFTWVMSIYLVLFSLDWRRVLISLAAVASFFSSLCIEFQVWTCLSVSECVRRRFFSFQWHTFHQIKLSEQ